MRLLLILCAVGAVLFSGYWVFAAQMITRQSADIIRQSTGFDATQGRVTGFPLDFRTELTQPNWRSQDGMLQWQAPVLKVETPSYQPNHIRATFPSEQRLAIEGTEVVLRSASMLATLTLRPDMQVSEARLDLKDATLAPTLMLAALGHADGSLRQLDAEQYAFALSADAITLAPDLRALLDPSQDLSDLPLHLELEGELGLDTPWMVQAPFPLPNRLDLGALHLDWGELRLSAEGHVQRNTLGGLDGTLSLTLSDWEPLHSFLTASGALEPDALMMAGMFLASIAQPDTGEITLSLGIDDSVLALGPFVIAQLPRF